MTPTPIAVIDGRSGRKLNNALTVTFVTGAGETLGTAQQGAEDNFGLKLGILFGLRNGYPANNALRLSNGSVVSIPTKAEGPTAVSRDGVALASIVRGEASTATAPDGTLLLRFLPHETEAKTDGAYRMLVHDATDTLVATLDVIRWTGQWNIGAEDVLELITRDFGGQVGSSLPIPFRGTRLVFYREPTPVELDLMLVACAEITLSARPYVAAMGTQGAAWM